MWGKKHVENTIPKELAKTWFAISEKLERPPILSYASYALNNWKMLDDTKPFDLENIVCLLYTSPSPRDVEESRMPSSA